ncbi:hypothetical protein ACFV0T_42010 [Streptomyces sp. NPDC059582]|uniref:hypothetical protein n=1 Tax=Streptomyces sp. NPDC059582 TaxID=3346875 RepID=UPI0036C3EFCF
MRKTASLFVAAAATASFLGLTVPTAQAYTWSCAGVQVHRCIAKSSGNVTVKFENKSSSAIRGQFGVTCAGSAGQGPKTLKNGTISARSGWSSILYTCPAGLRDSAFGWRIDPHGDVTYTPTIGL